MLPFERAEYRASLANHGARERFDALLERATCVLELPGDTRPRARRLCDDRPGDRRALRHADRGLGRPPAARPRRHRRGRAAGADARDRDRPRAARARAPTRAPVERVRPDGPDARRRSDRRAAARSRATSTPCSRGLLMPPPDEQEQRFPASASCSERLRHIRARIEYPLLLTAAGVRRFRRPRPHRRATPKRRSATNGSAIARAAPRRTISRRRSTCSKKRIAGPTGSRPTSPRPIAADTSSISCSAASRCASASAHSWRRTSSSRWRRSSC